MKVLCFLLFIGVTLGAKFPTSLKQCPENDQVCFTSAVQDAMKKLQNGLPSAGIVPLEPMLIPSLQIGAGKGAVNLVQNYKDIKIHGYSKSEVKNVKFDIKNKKLELEFLFPFVEFEGQYEVNGKVLLLPVFGKGHSSLKLDNLAFFNTMNFDQYQKNGKTYLKPVDSHVTFNPAKASYLFENLFNGEKKLGDQINKVINDNWKEVFDDVKGGYENAFAAIHLGIAKEFFSRIPISELFSK